MQKELKLIVIALCFPFVAFAQKPQTEQQPVTASDDDDTAFTFTEAQLTDDDNTLNTISIVGSNHNVYASEVGYRFSPARFKYRALGGKYNEMFINGNPANDVERGEFNFGFVGGLNNQTRSAEHVLPFEENNFAMTALAGSNNYNFRPSSMPTGHRASIAGGNRNYTVRGMYSYNSGVSKNGWIVSGALTYRWANMETANIEGTFYNALSYYLGVEKIINEKHSVSLVTWGNPTERAAQSASTDEMYWIANSRYYNPNWGWQDGKKRSARIVNDFAPTALLTWDWKIGLDTKLTTSLTGRYSYYKNTRLNYNNSENPKPDYWKNLPSSYYDVWYEDDVAGRTVAGYNDFMRAWAYLSGSEEARQIQWDRLYYANQQGNAEGRDAMYFITARYNNNINLALASTLNTKLNRNTTLNLGVQLAANISQNYQKIDDLMGASHVSNINTYALGNYPMGDPHVYYDMRNPTAELKEGDKYSMDYDLHTRKAQVWSSLKFGKGNYQGFLAGRVGGVMMYRDGKMENGIAVAQGNGVTSYGKSETGKFLDGGAKFGLTSHTLSKYGITWNFGIGYEFRAPTPKTAFVSPEVNNDFVKNLKNERVFSSEAGLQYETTWLKANIGGYFSRINDATEWQQFFDDDATSFTYVSMTNIQKEYYGLEWGVKVKLSPSFSANIIQSMGSIFVSGNLCPLPRC